MVLHATKVKVANESGEELYASPAELKKNDDDNFSPDMLLYDEPITSPQQSAYGNLARAPSTRSNASERSQYLQSHALQIIESGLLECATTAG